MYKQQQQQQQQQQYNVSKRIENDYIIEHAGGTV